MDGSLQVSLPRASLSSACTVEVTAAPDPVSLAGRTVLCRYYADPAGVTHRVPVGIDVIARRRPAFSVAYESAKYGRLEFFSKDLAVALSNAVDELTRRLEQERTLLGNEWPFAFDCWQLADAAKRYIFRAPKKGQPSAVVDGRPWTAQEVELKDGRKMAVPLGIDLDARSGASWITHFGEALFGRSKHTGDSAEAGLEHAIAELNSRVAHLTQSIDTARHTRKVMRAAGLCRQRN